RTKVFTTNGDLTLDEIVGELQVKSVSSDLVLRRITSSDVRIGTTSGEITYGGPIDPKGQYDFSTHSGEVRLEVPAGSGANLAVQTYSGDIHSDFRMILQPGENIRKTRGKKMEFTIGDGGAHVSIVTFSGDITIRRTGRAERNDQ